MDSVQISQTVLYYTTSVVLVLVAFFLIKLIMTSTKLAERLSKTTTILNEELEPTLKELKETLGSVNSMAKTADNEMTRVKTAIDNIAGVPFKLGQKMRGLFSGFAEGIQAGIKLFRK